MFKNSTRKGLAIGATFALAFTGLVSSPAQAAGEVVLEPSAGTSYATFVTEDFDLTASLAAGQPVANIAQLKYKIEKATGFAVSYSATATSAAIDAGTTSAVASASTSFVLTPAATSTTTANKISIAVAGATSASASVDVVVTAFLDSNSNGSVDAGEFATARTVSFKKYADVASVVAVAQPYEGDVTVSGTASFTGLNADQLSAADTKVVFSVGGAAETAVAATAGVFATAVSAITTSATVSAQAQYKTHNVGSADTKTVTNRTIASVTTSVVTGANAKGTDVRVNTEFQVKAVVKDGATTASPVAGAAVTVAVTTSRTLTSTISITVAGTTYTDSAKLPTALAVGTSDANGAVTFAISTTGMVDQDDFTVVASSQNITATRLDLNAETPAYQVVNDGGVYAKTTLGGSVTLGYTVADQFDVALSRADRIKVTYNGASKYAALTAGKASVALTASTASGALTVSATVEKQDTATLNWEDAADVTDAADVNLNATSVADSFDTAPAVTKSASISRVNADGDLTNEVQITGSSVNNAGAVVTIASAGLKFAKTSGGDVVADSVTITTGANGDFNVYAYSHIAGTATISYTVGSVTKTTTLTTAAAAYNEGKVVTVTTNAVGGYAAPGSTVRATVKVVDEYGNPVQNSGTTASFGVTVAGPGFVSALPTSTGADGNSAVFSILLGSADAGDLVITATYDADGATTTIAAITTVATVTVGTAPAADQKLTVGTFNGYIAIYAKGYEGSKLSAKVAGKWLTVAELSNFQRVVRKTGAGYSIKVDLYIDGVFAQSSTTVTK